ncbi:MAG: tripartite tricarboxylate transporter substrate binding protein [Betaproteobacteria bacterium]|jgi:tripartite-type tricarboxylate transporter receptor subunit TctC
MSHKRQGGSWTGWIGLLWGFSALAGARDDYPQRPIRLIVPFATGGAADIVARLISNKLTEGLGQSVVVDVRPGAGSVLGTDLAAHSAPDGHTLVMVANAHVINPGLLNKMPYDAIKDFSPITLAVDSPLVFVVPASQGLHQLTDLIALAKSKPAQITYGSAGQGTSGHLAIELLSFKTGIKLIHVPYKGAGQALVDLIGGQIQLVCTSSLPALPGVRSGQLRALALTSAQRSPIAPDIPTVAEAAGLPGFRASTWYALLAPAKTPKPIINKLYEVTSQALKSQSVSSKLLQQGAQGIGNTPEELLQFLQTEMQTLGQVIRVANVKPNT